MTDLALDIRTSGRRRVARTASVTVTAAVVGFWLLVLRPVSLGGPADYVIISGQSMEPALVAGDVVVALRQEAYAVGDVVVYRVPGGPGAGDRVIHRIRGGTADGYTMKGDNKDGIDPWRPAAEDIVGKARLTVPHAGAGVTFLRSSLGVALLAGLTTLVVALAGTRPRPPAARDPA